MRKLLSFLLSFSFAFLGLFVSLACSKALEKDRIDVLQKKSVTQQKRHEFTPLFSVSLNDPYVRTLAGGLNYAYHFTDGIALELSGAYTYGMETSLVEQIQGKGSTSLLKKSDGSSSSTQLSPVLSKTQFLVFANFLWTPFHAKVAIGRSVFQWNLFLVSGFGFVKTEDENLFGATIGFGARFFLTDWLAWRIDFRDIVYTQTIPSQNVGLLTHNFYFSTGLSFFLPIRSIFLKKK